jgi:hypothetical protein
MVHTAKLQARAFHAAEASDARKQVELDKAVAAGKEEMGRRVAAVKSRVALKAKRAAAKIADLKREADTGGNLKNMLLQLASKLE